MRAIRSPSARTLGRGQPDLIERDPTGAIARWIDVGLPDEQDVRRASHKSGEMVLLTYGGRIAEMWWQQNGSKLAGLANLTVIDVSRRAAPHSHRSPAASMRLSCTIRMAASGWPTTPATTNSRCVGCGRGGGIIVRTITLG